MELTLSQKVSSYIEKKEQALKLEAELKGLNADIKKEMDQLKVSELKSDIGVIIITEAKTEGWDEDGLLKYLQDKHPDAIVQTPSINLEKFEKLIYEDELVRKDIVKYKQTKITKKMTYKVTKSAGKEEASDIVDSFKKRT